MTNKLDAGKDFMLLYSYSIAYFILIGGVVDEAIAAERKLLCKGAICSNRHDNQFTYFVL